MTKRTQMAGWLQMQLEASCIQPVYAAVFGSIAQGNTSPSDCDVLVVLERPKDGVSWKAITAAKRGIKSRFRDVWRLPLTLMVMILEEVAEDTDFNRTIFNGELIPLAGTLNDLVSKLESEGLRTGHLIG